MALLASSVSPSTLNIKVNQFEHRPSSQHHGFLQLDCHPRVSPKHRLKITMAQFGEPNKIKEQFVIIKDKLWETTPETVKEFPWKKAENLLLGKLVFVGQKALRLSLATVFALSCLSDFVYSISRNQELMIPIGLMVGCLMTDFLKEISQAAFRSSPEGMVLKWHLLAIGSFLVVVKLVSAFFAVQTQVFLRHVANGGLMQVLWIWRRSLPEENAGVGGNSFSMQDGSSIADA